MSFELSKYQKDILTYVKEDQRNLLVEAKAGSGKTSTLVLVSNEIKNQDKRCTFLAFNKSIVEELKKKVDTSVCSVSTIHSLGLTFLRSYLYKKYNTNYELKIDDKKLSTYIDKYFDEILMNRFKESDEVRQMIEGETNPYERDRIFKDFTYKMKKFLEQLINRMKLKKINFNQINHVIRESRFQMSIDLTNGLQDYMDDNNFNKNINYERAGYGFGKDLELLIEFFDKVYNAIIYDFDNPIKDDNKYIITIDFLDMIYFPVLYNMYVPFSIKDTLDYILVDEAQDLSILQHNFLKLLDRGDNRFIFVGDRRQAIYAFAGADTKSLDNIEKMFKVKEKPLNICYRCPKLPIKLAQTLVPDIEYNPIRENRKYRNYRK